MEDLRAPEGGGQGDDREEQEDGRECTARGGSHRTQNHPQPKICDGAEPRVSLTDLRQHLTPLQVYPAQPDPL